MEMVVTGWGRRWCMSFFRTAWRTAIVNGCGHEDKRPRPWFEMASPFETEFGKLLLLEPPSASVGELRARLLAGDYESRLSSMMASCATSTSTCS